jgi:hypothetical protein
MWVPKVAEALIGDTGLMALLDSIGKNQVLLILCTHSFPAVV